MTAPHDLDLERAMLGYLQICPADYRTCVERVAPETFYRQAHARLWTVYGEIQPDLTPFRALEALTRQGWGDELTLADLSRLTDGVPRSFNLSSAVTQLGDLADRRRLQGALARAQQTVETAPTADEAAADVITSVRESVTTRGAQGRSLGAAIATVIATLDEAPDATPTGFPTLDRWGCGFRPGEFVILAGRPSQGKTALAQALAQHVARAGTQVWLASLEMSAAAVSLRWLASTAGVDLLGLRGAHVTPPDYDRVSQAVGTLSDLPITVHDHAGITLGDLRRLVLGQRGLLIVDYLQLMRPPPEATRYGNRVQEVGALSRGLKAIAHDGGVTVLALSQLSRAVEARADKAPQLSDLRDSGELEQDADQVWMIWRPPTYDADELADRAVLKVAKHRNGPTGAVELVFHAPHTSFRERTASDPWPAPTRPTAKAAHW